MLKIRTIIIGVILFSIVSACGESVTSNTLSLSERTVSIIVVENNLVSISGEKFTLKELDGKLDQLARDCNCTLNATLATEESASTSTLVAVIDILSISNSVGSISIVAVQEK